MFLQTSILQYSSLHFMLNPSMKASKCFCWLFCYLPSYRLSDVLCLCYRKWRVLQILLLHRGPTVFSFIVTPSTILESVLNLSGWLNRMRKWQCILLLSLTQFCMVVVHCFKIWWKCFHFWYVAHQDYSVGGSQDESAP